MSIGSCSESRCSGGRADENDVVIDGKLPTSGGGATTAGQTKDSCADIGERKGMLDSCIVLSRMSSCTWGIPECLERDAREVDDT